MRSSKKQFKEANLYLILDRQVLDYDSLLKVLKVAVRCGVDIVQLRDKFGTARDILDFSRQAMKIGKEKVLFILNDRADLALLANSDGLHLGQDDIDLVSARKILGSKKILGVSCQTLAQAMRAEAEGADYIGFGSVFKTKTKPEREPLDQRILREVAQKIKIPVFPIGGINSQNLKEVTATGIHRVAICRDILLAEDVSNTVREFRKLLNGV